jgi:hypothetical protein
MTRAKGKTATWADVMPSVREAIIGELDTERRCAKRGTARSQFFITYTTPEWAARYEQAYGLAIAELRRAARGGKR